jgi:hypothetical protein
MTGGLADRSVRLLLSSSRGSTFAKHPMLDRRYSTSHLLGRLQDARLLFTFGRQHYQAGGYCAGVTHFVACGLPGYDIPLTVAGPEPARPNDAQRSPFQSMDHTVREQGSYQRCFNHMKPHLSMTLSTDPFWLSAPHYNDSSRNGHVTHLYTFLCIDPDMIWQCYFFI